MEESTPLVSSRPKLVKMRRLAYFSSAICCTMSASFTVFSLYTEAFETDLNYNALEINYISIVAEMGLYLCVPLLGFFADAYRLSYIGVLSCVAFIIGYGGCSWVVSTQQPWQLMAVFFGIVGVACSASFISSLVNCARLFPNSALLAIALPTTLYGGSSLLYAQVIQSFLDSGKKLSDIFFYLGACLFFVGILATLAPIWGQVDSCIEFNSVASEETIEVPKSHIQRFFSDYKTPMFLVAFVLVSGPLEMYQNNLGLVTKLLTGSTDSVSHQVSLFTGLSTVTRLIVGGVTDSFKVNPPTLLVLLLLVLAVADFAFMLGWLNLSYFSAISGIGYGSSFTLFPMIVSHVWGIEGFATYWGMFILGPAVGSLIFSVLFAQDVQGSHSYKTTFAICAFVVVISCILIRWLKLHLHYGK